MQIEFDFNGNIAYCTKNISNIRKKYTIQRIEHQNPINTNILINSIYLKRILN